jgi:hypothetical protein
MDDSNVILEVLDRAGIEEGRIEYAYEGRNMHGKTCWGFVGHVRDLGVFLVELGRTFDIEGGDHPRALARDVRSESFGRSEIFYFPTYQLTERA